MKLIGKAQDLIDEEDTLKEIIRKKWGQRINCNKQITMTRIGKQGKTTVC